MKAYIHLLDLQVTRYKVSQCLKLLDYNWIMLLMLLNLEGSIVNIPIIKNREGALPIKYRSKKLT